ncbi:MAG: signal peptidase I [Clostridia bacterium]|nr:signal peptidase I [Clostridia bacterium]
MERIVTSSDAKKHLKRRIVSKAVSAGLVISTIVCFAVLFQSVTTQQVSFFGFRLFYVKTGSMAPAIPTGSILVVQKRLTDITIGDVITFRSPDGVILGLPNTHRVVSQVEKGGTIWFQTRGDANPGPDANLVSREDVIGKVVFVMDKTGILSLLIGFLGTRLGFLLLILIPLLSITLVFLRDLVQIYQLELARAAAREIGTDQANPDRLSEPVARQR